MLQRLVRMTVLLVLAALLAATVPANAGSGGKSGKSSTKPSPSVASATVAKRAMWVWDKPSVTTLVDFARANGVTELFVHVPTSLDLAWFTTLRNSTRAAGIKVQALGSETWWIDSPDAAVAWQQRAVATGLFDGVHLDIEPWLHADWDLDRPALVTRYLHLLDRMAASGVPVELDISFWLHEIAAPGGGRLDEAVLARVDAVTVMSYRDTATGPDSITGLGAAALGAAARAGKPARLAVETNYLGSTAVDQKQTFHGERRARMTTVMSEVDAALAGSTAYAGIAVHDRRGWAAMKR